MIKIEYALIVTNIAVVNVKIKNVFNIVMTQKITDGHVIFTKYIWKIKRILKEGFDDMKKAPINKYHDPIDYSDPNERIHFPDTDGYTMDLDL